MEKSNHGLVKSLFHISITMSIFSSLVVAGMRRKSSLGPGCPYVTDKLVRFSNCHIEIIRCIKSPLYDVRTLNNGIIFVTG